MAVYFLFTFNFRKFSRLYISGITSKLISFKWHKLKNNAAFHTYRRFSTKLPYSVSEKLSFSSDYLHTVRKNHFQPKAQKLILKPAVDNKEKYLLHTQLLESLQKCKTIEEQIRVFYSLIKLPDEEIKCRHSICQELENILQPHFPSCSVHLLGSSANGFGYKGCDVDLTIQLPNKNADNCRKHAIPLNEITQTERKFSDEAYISKKNLLTIRKILQSLNYGEPLAVIPGRCPILNFTAKKLSCDLSVNNSSALNSTNLILLCGKLDERIIPLVQIIVYWAKHSKLVGGFNKFKTYAIFLMVVYYLQTRSPPVLPSIETMLKKTELLEHSGNWSYDVKQYLNQFEKSKNNQTIEQLLREFFFFYGNYDFSHVICPINSSSFNAKLNCNKKFEVNSISVQDPFELEYNVTTGTSWASCKNFSKAVIAVWEKYLDKYYWIPGPHDWGISSLINSKFSYNTLRAIKELCIDIPFESSVIDNFMKRNFDDLLEQAAKNLKYIFSYCLQFNCYDQSTNFNVIEIPWEIKTAIENLFYQKSNINHSAKKIFIPMDNSKDNDIYLITQYICATQYTWSGRNSYISLFESPENVFKMEHHVSKKMAKDRERDEKQTFYFLCECYAINAENNVYFRVILKPLSDDKFNPKLALFLQDYIPKLMNKVSYECQN